MGTLVAGTIVTKNYLPFARVLVASLRRFHPDLPFFLVLADEGGNRIDPDREPFRILSLADLQIPNLTTYRFRYARRQVVIAAKPFLLNHLLNRGFSSAIYLDADILVLAELSDLFERVKRHATVLTPHHAAPLTGDRRTARELATLRAGIYNAGFVGVSEAPASRRLLAWWQARLHNHCQQAVEKGLHHDQRWLDMAPAFVEDVDIARESGYNVAYWNLPERRVRLHADDVWVTDGPCRFFHFSGFDPDRPDQVTRHQPDLPMASVGPAAKLFSRYLTLLEEAGYLEARTWPYAYDAFDNGVPIPDIVREIYDELGEDGRRFGDPLRTGSPASYYRWLTAPVDVCSNGSQAVTRLWQLIYQRRPDLKRAFPDHLGSDRAAFLEWTVRHGRTEYGIGATLAGSADSRT